MNHLVLFVFVLIGSSMADNDSAFGCHKKFMGQLSALSSNSNSAACGYFVDYIKCFIRAMDWDNLDEIEEYYEPFESDLNDQMRRKGFDCPIDISEIFDELRNAGCTSSPIGWLVAMVTSFLVMLQQLNVI